MIVLLILGVLVYAQSAWFLVLLLWPLFKVIASIVVIVNIDAKLTKLRETLVHMKPSARISRPAVRYPRAAYWV